MIASKETQNASRLTKAPDFSMKILQATAVFGANASGKSNLTKAIAFAKELVVVGTRPESQTGRTPFRLRESSIREPTRFEFTILAKTEDGERVYRYGFSIDCAEVLEEKLVEIRATSERPIFTRVARSRDEPHSYSFAHWERRGIKEEDRQYLRFLARGTRRNQLFLREALERELRVLAPVYRWFREQLVILSPTDEYQPLEIVYENRPELQNYVSELLDKADTGVVAVKPEEIPFDSLGIPSHVKDDITNSLKESGTGMLLRSSFGPRRSIFLHNGELKASRIVTYHQSINSGIPVPFDTTEESDGTLRLLDLAPVFFDLSTVKNSRTYIIDELDRSLHPSLLLVLVREYLRQRTPDHRAQLIFTTHDVQLLENRTLRRDEIAFMKRNNNGASKLRSLSEDKSIRYDLDLRRAYLKGVLFGGPELGKFQNEKRDFS